MTKLRYGMVGGGEDSFVGVIHRKALEMDGNAILVSGCFSRDADRTRIFGSRLGLFPERLYDTAEDMARGEAGKLDFVVIVTPNDAHFPVAKSFLEQGIAVVCDKPMTVSFKESEELCKLVHTLNLPFCVTYTYSGYTMVKQVRDMIHQGDIGDIRFVNCEYPQSWLAAPIELDGHPQALWRTDPERSGPSLCLGDIGTHVEHLVSYTTGIEIERVSASLQRLVPDRALDDNARIMVDYKNGASGLYWCSQVAVGHANGLRLRVFGDKGGIEWFQEQPDQVRFTPLGGATQILQRDGAATWMSPKAAAFSRAPIGHPEGWVEAFANIYSEFCLHLKDPDSAHCDYPTVEDGAQGIRFIEACVESSWADSEWVYVKEGC